MQSVPCGVMDIIMEKAGKGGRARLGATSDYFRACVRAYHLPSPETTLAIDVFHRLESVPDWEERVLVARRLESHWETTGVKFHITSSPSYVGPVLGEDTVQMFTLPTARAPMLTVTWRRATDLVTLCLPGGCQATKPIGASRWEGDLDPAGLDTLKQWFPLATFASPPRAMRPPRWRPRLPNQLPFVPGRVGHEYMSHRASH